MNEFDMRKLAMELAVASRTAADVSPDDIINRAAAYFGYLKDGRNAR